jgi:plastocyanin
MRATTKLLTVLAMAAALTPMAPAAAATTDAAIADFAFSPKTLSVTVGDTVKWTNGDEFPHTVTADNGSFESDSLSDGETFSHTFGQAGTFAYHCDIHESMTGTVQVGPQPTTTTTTAAPTTTTRATTTSTAPRSTTTAPRPTTTVSAEPTSTTVAPVAPTNPPATEATPPASETTPSTLVVAGASDGADDGIGAAGLLAAGAALLLLAGSGGWWARRRFRRA